MKTETYILMRDYSFRNINNLNFNELESFDFKPINNVNYEGIKVSAVNMFNRTFISNLLKRKIPKKLEIYLRYIISIIDADGDDSTDITSLRAALNDLTKYKETVRYKYRKYLDERYAALLMQKIEMLEEELKKKIINYKEIDEKEFEEVRKR